MHFVQFLLVTIVLAVAAAGHAQAADDVIVGDVPLPHDLRPVQPIVSAFSGTWVGKWDNQRNHILVVKSVTPDGSADVIYAVGGDNVGRGRWFNRKARIEGRTLTFVDDGFDARYELSDTGRMRGVFDDNRGFAILQRQNLSKVLSAPKADWFSIGTIEYLKTQLVENGQSVRLASVIYKPKGEVPFPLAIIHHGSTGSGKIPFQFKQIWTNDWLADVLNAHGWMVAFPQRRGRGGSDGLYDEGFATDRSEGYSPKAALSLPGAERALTDAQAALATLKARADVSGERVLLGGVSRGGVVAIMQAGSDPDAFSGVINFVGGWVSEGWGDAEINPTLFARIGSFKGRVLSIYGDDDPYYSLDHARANLAEMVRMGAASELHSVDVPGFQNGHWAIALPNLWEDVATRYLRKLQPQRQ